MSSDLRYCTVIVWFRRDLRVHDNAALSAACAQSEYVVPLFILDDDILHRADTGSARVIFLLDALRVLDQSLKKRGGSLILRRGKALHQILSAVNEFHADAIFFQREIEPYGRNRDNEIKDALSNEGIAVEGFDGLSLIEPERILSAAGTAYTVFGAYKKQWHLASCETPILAPKAIALLPGAVSDPVPSVDDLKIANNQSFDCGGEDAAKAALEDFVTSKLASYGEARDTMSLDGTSKLSRHLHFGTICPRTVAAAVKSMGIDDSLFLNEMAWRDFYMSILYHFPHAGQGAFRQKWDEIPWENDQSLFEAWKEGRTGYPIVDAAMRQMNSTAWMHNRSRMIVASFLTKDLLIDWRWGEEYFMQKLVDGDQAANNGGWQWVAGTGTDAQPYFRIFNPVTQGKKFDPNGAYVRQWIPELAHVPDRVIHEPWKLSAAEKELCHCTDYPTPVIDHAVQRGRALEMYAKAANK